MCHRCCAKLLTILIEELPHDALDQYDAFNARAPDVATAIEHMFSRLNGLTPDRPQQHALAALEALVNKGFDLAAINLARRLYMSADHDAAERAVAKRAVGKALGLRIDAMLNEQKVTAPPSAAPAVAAPTTAAPAIAAPAAAGIETGDGGAGV